MSYEQCHERFFRELHKIAGVCGHCGRRACSGRSSNSVVPAKIACDDVIAAWTIIRRKKSHES